jgi:L-2-hydroxyglutarate oxidase
MIFDFCVIGGGIVGLATAVELGERVPGASILVLEKEAGIARHQTGHNSGVIHSGLYYKPGSLKADLCRRGAEATKAFCTTHAIPFDTRGKLVVATSEIELTRMKALIENGRQNRIEVEALDARELRRREPNVAGLGAIFVPSTGIVDYVRVSEVMAALVRERGGSLLFDTAVDAIREEADAVVVAAGANQWRARRLIACAGLQSDRIARLAGIAVDYQVVPFRGEYYNVAAAKRDLVHHLIYPVPDPDLPFLGIHLTPTIGGELTVGPNAVLGLSREGYARLSTDPRDVATYLRFPGFWRMALHNWRSGLSEARNSLSRKRYLVECRKYCPSLTEEDLVPREAGIRAQAILRDGTLVHDFLFFRTPRMLHVGNAASPAATAAIPIAQMIAARAIAAADAHP